MLEVPCCGVLCPFNRCVCGCGSEPSRQRPPFVSNLVLLCAVSDDLAVVRMVGVMIMKLFTFFTLVIFD